MAEPNPDGLQERILAALSRLGIALREDRWRGVQPHGLSATQAQALSVLASRGPLRLTALARALGVRAPTVTRLVASLLEKELVERVPDPEDRRSRLVRVTDRGEALAREVSSWSDTLLASVDLLPEADQGTLLRLLTRLIAAMQDQGRIDVARVCVTCRYFQPDVHPGSDRPHHCAFVDAPLADADLRVDCPDHRRPLPPGGAA